MPGKEKPTEKEPSWLRILRWSLAGGFTLLFLVLVLCQSNSGFLSSLPGRYLTKTFAFLAVGAFLFVRKRLPHPFIGRWPFYLPSAFPTSPSSSAGRSIPARCFPPLCLPSSYPSPLPWPGASGRKRRRPSEPRRGPSAHRAPLFPRPHRACHRGRLPSPFPFGIPSLVAAVLGTLPGVYLAIKK